MSARGAWLFSPAVDLGVFLGSAVLSLLLVALGSTLGVRSGETPEWTWVATVLLVDVAHVWGTAFRVYLDGEERARRPVLYAAVPALAYAALVALHAQGELVFWRVLAYVAAFHFVRQQWGWVALYRSKGGERDRAGAWLDWAAIHIATIYPLVWWHAHLPRRFAWFMANDFLPAPEWVERVLHPLWAAVLVAYFARALVRHLGGRGAIGKDVVVATTALTWWVGIVAKDSDFAFTVTNVIGHGVPYFALVYWHGRRRAETAARPGPLAIFKAGPIPFLLALWLAAYCEELLWDRALWHEREWLFGAGWDLATVARAFLVPALALPQVVHYVLDGFVWRRRTNPTFTLVPRPEAVAA